MRYQKPALTFEDQANLLISRGLEADQNELISILKKVSYYRLSGYLYPFRNVPGDDYKKGTKLAKVWEQYKFDRDLRLIVFGVIESLEISLRTQITYHFSHEHGPFGYKDYQFMRGLKEKKYLEWKEAILKEFRRGNEKFINHFQEKYGDQHSHPPLWMLTEVMTLGSLLYFYRGMGKKIKHKIANILSIEIPVLASWLLSLLTVRNICAHHGRLWNRGIGTKPKIPRKDNHPNWHVPVPITNMRIFGVLSICSYMLKRLNNENDLFGKLNDLLDKYPNVPPSNMGFPEDWRDSPIWTKVSS